MRDITKSLEINLQRNRGTSILLGKKLVKQSNGRNAKGSQNNCTREETRTRHEENCAGEICCVYKRDAAEFAVRYFQRFFVRNAPPRSMARNYLSCLIESIGRSRHTLNAYRPASLWSRIANFPILGRSDCNYFPLRIQLRAVQLRLMAIFLLCANKDDSSRNHNRR